MPRARAIVLAEHGESPVHLTSPQRTLLAEALRRGEDLREQVESHVISYGRWLLGAVFDNDAAAALDDKTDNAVWRELVRRAGGPTLNVSRRMLYVALQIAAHDKRITDQAWRGLDAGRKELLLPLGADRALRGGAQHVAKFNLTHASTRAYVAAQLKSQGKPPALRLTVPAMVKHVRTLRAKLGTAPALRRLAAQAHKLDAPARNEAADEIDRLRGALSELSKTLRKG